MTTKIYRPEELTNEQYRELPHICGTDIVTLMNTSPNKWRNAKRKQSDALGFGIASHLMMLEPERFDKFVAVEPDISEAMKTVSELKEYAKNIGLKIPSSALKADIISMILEADHEAMIADEIIALHAEENKGKQILKFDDYQKIIKMRNVLRSKKMLCDLIDGGSAEISITTEIYGIPVKIRPDLITLNGGIIDYKTTRDCNPEIFIKDAFNKGYFAKMAFQHDVFEAAYGRPPSFVALLPQDKDEGYDEAVHECYLLVLKPEQLEIGRMQYKPMLVLANECLKNNDFPCYANDEVISVDTPVWIAKQYLI